MVPPVTPATPSARSAALDALRRARKTRTFLRDALHAVFEETRLEPRDRALATQLAAGVSFLLKPDHTKRAFLAMASSFVLRSFQRWRVEGQNISPSAKYD